MQTSGREVDRKLIFEELKAEYLDEYADRSDEELLEQANYFQDTHGVESEIEVILDFVELTQVELREVHRIKLIEYCAEEHLKEEW